MTVIAPRAGDEAELRGLSVMEEAKAGACSCQGVARHYSCELVPIDELEQLALGYGSVVGRACVRLTAKCPWRAPTISVTNSSSSVAKNPSWAGRRADRARP
jgi:hypothetical protein